MNSLSVQTRGGVLKFICDHTDPDGSQSDPAMYVTSMEVTSLLWNFYGILCGDQERIAKELSKSGMHNPSGVTAVELANWFVSSEPDSKTRMIVAMGLLAGICLKPEEVDKLGSDRVLPALQRHMDGQMDFYQALDLIGHGA